MSIIFHTYSQAKVKSIIKNKVQQTQSIQTASAKVKQSNHKLTIETESPNHSCSTIIDVCEKAILPFGQENSYSEYVWADKGQKINFGGTSHGQTEIIWAESETGGFMTDLKIITSNQTKHFSFLAPFDGNYRLAIETASVNSSGEDDGYIEDAWAK